MKFKGFLIIISMIIFYMVNVSAQVISSEIEKQQKERIKLLKKEHKLTDVSVEISGNNNWLFKLKKKAFIGYNYGYADQNGKIILSPEYEEIVMKRNIDGFNYYEIKKSRNNIGVALTNGTIIIEPKYSDITYISRLDKEGSSNKIEVGSEMVETPYIWHKASDEIFICSDSYGSKEISLYTKEGKRIFNRKSEDWIGVVRVLPGYLVIDWGNNNTFLNSSKIVTSIRENELLLIDFNGNIILENVNSLHFDEENMVKYSIKDNGEELYGAIKLNDSNWRIAPKFCYLSISSLDSNIKGKLTSNGEIIMVNPNISYSHEYKDIGEKLFEQKKWDEVLEFYKYEGVDAPWAKFFSGSALYHKALEILTKIEFYIAGIKGYAESTNGLIKFPEPMMDVPALLPDIEHMGFTSSQLLSQYLAEDNIYAEKAKTLMNIKEYTQDKSQKLYADYETAMKMANEKDQKTVAQLEARRQRIQDERSQLLESICGIFLKSLYNSISNNRFSGSRSVGTGYSVGTSSSNESMSTEARYKADWENRRSNAQRQLERYNEQLKRDPNNSALKHNIHSTQEVIKTCDEALSR